MPTTQIQIRAQACAPQPFLGVPGASPTSLHELVADQAQDAANIFTEDDRERKDRRRAGEDGEKVRAVATAEPGCPATLPPGTPGLAGASRRRVSASSRCHRGWDLPA